MIQFKNVNFSYENRIKVLEGLSFDIQPGEHVGLIGANGAGKSTIMKAILGLVATEGYIEVGGMEMTRDNLPAIRSLVGYVLQDSDSQMFMPTVLEDMLFGLINSGMSRDQADDRVAETLSALKLEYLADKYNHKISGGEKRMAAIATVLAMKPDCILMDEPSASLDPRNRRRLINLIKTLKQTMLIASHDLDMVLDVCDRVILVNEGHLIAEGPTEEIIADRDLLEANGLELPFCLQRIN